IRVHEVYKYNIQSIHRTLREIGQYLQLWQIMQRSELSATPDRLIWRWTASGNYSTQSCYMATFHGSTACYSWKLIWKCWAP
uniref:Uncharacterized protein n=1 Tax=Aegilops tauschii subsp. strangulata TaxID=200361 RepID=A0A453BH82_AEGTS